MALDSMKEIFERSARENIPFWEIVLQYDMEERQVSRQASMAKMLSTWQAIQDAADSYTGTQRSVSGLVGGDGLKMRLYARRGESIGGEFMDEVIVQAISMAESNACMRRIVAAPTAGSCGVVPAVLLPLCEREHYTQHELLEALYVASGIGAVIAYRASISGAAGGIGTTLIQMAKDKGMDVVASASTDEKCAVLRQVGADCVFNRNKADAREIILNHTNGRGVDLIYDQLCGPEFSRQFDYLADFGQIVLYNWLKGSPELDQLDTIIKRAWHGNAIRCFSFHAFDDKPERRLANAAKCFEMVRDGRVKPLVCADLPLSEARKAHEMLDAGEIIGKLIMHP